MVTEDTPVLFRILCARPRPAPTITSPSPSRGLSRPLPTTPSRGLTPGRMAKPSCSAPAPELARRREGDPGSAPARSTWIQAAFFSKCLQAVRLRGRDGCSILDCGRVRSTHAEGAGPRAGPCFRTAYAQRACAGRGRWLWSWELFSFFAPAVWTQLAVGNRG